VSRILLLIVTLIVSCSSQNREQGYVYYRLSANPTTLDPAFIVDVSGGAIAAKLFNGLVRLNPDLDIAPDIAKHWTISKDGLRYRFYLKEGLRFSNGREVTAKDFKYSFQRVLSPQTASPNTWVFEKILGAKDYLKGQTKDVKGIRVLGRQVLEIRLESPFSPFLYLLTMTPAYVVPEEEVKRLGPDFSSNPVGTGPYILGHWAPNRELVLEKRDDYFDTPPKVKGIVYRIIPEDLTALAEFELGNLDAISLPGSQYSRYKNSKKWSNLIVSIEGLNTYYLGLNCSKPPFNDPDMRRAVSHAIDREKILRTIYEGRGRLASGAVPDSLRKWTPPTPYDYNPKRAKEIFSLKKPKEVLFYVTADSEVVDMAEVIQAYLKDAGLKVSLRQLEWSAYKEAINKGEPDMFWLSWWADYPEPENFLYPLFHSSNIGPPGNRTRYSNPEVDALIEKGRLSFGKERDRAYERAESIIVSDAPWVFFWHRNDYAVRQRWLKGFKLYPIYSMDKGTEVEITSF